MRLSEWNRRWPRLGTWSGPIVAVVLLLHCLAGSTGASALECYETEFGATMVTEGTRSIALVYVTFPVSSYDTEPDPSLPTLDTARTLTVPSSLEVFYTRQSKGKLSLSFDVLEIPGSPGEMWLADHSFSVYADPAQVLQLQPNNSGCYAGVPGTEPVGTRPHTDGELTAEILRKIVTAYGSDDPLTSVDWIALVYSAQALGNLVGTSSTPGGWSGLGHCDVCGPACSEIPDGVDGVTIVWGPGSSNATAVELFAHELGHKILSDPEQLYGAGWDHTRGNFAGTTGQPEETYNYANYSLMRPSYVPNEGALPIVLPELLSNEWLDIPPVISGTTRAMRVFDLRHDAGKAYMVPILEDTYTLDLGAGVELEVEDRQGFWLSYHSGMDGLGGVTEDGEPSAQSPSESIYRSAGLMVWHVLERRVAAQTSATPLLWPAFMDIEAAGGRYSQPWSPSLSVADPVSGFDALDRWPSPEHESQSYWSSYRGSPTDFFSTATGQSHEFSYRTNPNTFGQSQLTYSSQGPGMGTPVSGSRRSPQSTATPLFVDVIAEGVTPEGVPYADVDILYAPHEEVLWPNAREHYAVVGQASTIRWTMDRSWGWSGAGAYDPAEVLIIDNVDIELSLDGGSSYQFLAQAVPNTGEHLWTPSPGMASENARIRVTFENIFNDDPSTVFFGEVGVDESDESFLIVEPAIAFDDETTVSSLASGAYSAVLVQRDVSGNEDLSTPLEEALVQYQRQSNSVGSVPTFDDKRQEVGIIAVESHRGTSVADFDNDGDLDLFLAHGHTSKLYRNDGPGFVDVSASLGVSAFGDSCVAAVWGDYDRDGYVDLYLCRTGGLLANGTFDPAKVSDGSADGARNFLLRNETYLGNGFVDVTEAAGLHRANSSSVSASWVDVDQDGALDLYVCWAENYHGDWPLGWAPLYRNQGDGTFVDVSVPVQQLPYVDGTKMAALGFVHGATWADFNGDGYLDVALSRQSPETALVPDNVYMRLSSTESTPPGSNDHFPGRGRFTVDPSIGPRALVPALNIVAQDLDLNGTTDVVATPALQTDIPVAVLGYSANGVVQHIELGGALGLSQGQATALLVADLNEDGDMDLYLGRDASEQRYYQNRQPSGVDSPSGNYLQVRVLASEDGGLTWDGGNNLLGIGAQVQVSAPSGNPEVQQTQLIDGGSGRGGQAPLELTFGLGSHTTADILVTWPDGSTTEVTGVSAGSGLITVADDHMPVLHPATIVGYAQPQPNGKVDWVFEWETAYSTNPAQDAVVIKLSSTKEPPQCYMTETTIDATTYGVVHSMEPVAGGGIKHVLRWTNRPCNAPCNMLFKVLSGVGSRSEQRAWYPFSVPVCSQ